VRTSGLSRPIYLVLPWGRRNTDALHLGEESTICTLGNNGATAALYSRLVHDKRTDHHRFPVDRRLFVVSTGALWNLRTALPCQRLCKSVGDSRIVASGNIRSGVRRTHRYGVTPADYGVRSGLYDNRPRVNITRSTAATATTPAAIKKLVSLGMKESNVEVVTLKLEWNIPTSSTL
jgi:hypothetical protein